MAWTKYHIFKSSGHIDLQVGIGKTLLGKLTNEFYVTQKVGNVWILYCLNLKKKLDTIISHINLISMY